MGKRLTYELNDELEKSVEDWRAKQRPIPSLKNAITTLLKAGLKA